MHTILIMGVRDGMGASTVAVNAALTLARRGLRVLVIDADPDHGGDVAGLLGLQSVRSCTDVVAAMDRLPAEALWGFVAATTRGVGVMRSPSCRSGGPDGAVPLEVLAGAIAALMTRLPEVCDAMVIDAGSRCTPQTALWWPHVTRWIAVVRPELFAVRSGVRLIHQWRRALVPVQAMQIVVNATGEEPLIAPQVIAEQLAVPAVSTLPGVVQAAAAAAEGHPLVLRDSTAPFARALELLVASWTDMRDPVRGVQPALCFPDLSPWECAVPADSQTGETIQTMLLSRLYQSLDLERVEAQGEAALQRYVEQALAQVIDDTGCAERVDRAMIARIMDDVLRCGPLEPWLADPEVSEIMVNGMDGIYIERAGSISRAPAQFSGRDRLYRVVERMVAPTGRRVDERSPIVDTRLPDGSRVNVVLPPLALDGPIITIRRFAKEAFTLERLCAAGSLGADLSAQLRAWVTARKNLLVIGGTGSGKTTLLGALSACVAPSERIITIEDAAELRLQQPHVVRLEARPANLEGDGAVTIRDLVRTALRMRPDRILVGECRGAEALDMLQAMHTGHDGSMTTLHANSPREAVGRLATLVCFAGLDLGRRAILEQIAGAIDVIVQVARCGAARRVVAVSEVAGYADDQVVLRECPL